MRGNIHPIARTPNHSPTAQPPSQTASSATPPNRSHPSARNVALTRSVVGGRSGINHSARPTLVPRTVIGLIVVRAVVVLCFVTALAALEGFFRHLVGHGLVIGSRHVVSSSSFAAYAGGRA